MRSHRTVAVALASALLTVLGACTATPNGPDQPEPLRLVWQELDLPAPPPGEHNAPRAVAACAGRWYVTGAYAAAGGATRPAAWTSVDARSWSAMTIAAESYYGHRSVLYSAACHDGRLAAVGGKPGGAHGNPRVSTWHLTTAPGTTAPGTTAPGTTGPGAEEVEVLTEVGARFELYGGPSAVNVARLVAGPAGWLITGNRSSGAAVWLSPDAAEFRIVEAAPVLASTPGLDTWASDAVAHDGRWTVVGGALTTGRIDRDAAVWTSPDGETWRGESVPSTGDYDEMTLVVDHGAGLVAVGLNGGSFQSWRLVDDGWRLAGTFGSTRPPAEATGARAPALAAGLAAAGGLVVAAVSDGVAHRLWVSADGAETWRELLAPTALPAGAERAVAVAGIAAETGRPDRLLLTTDDGERGRIYLAEVSS